MGLTAFSFLLLPLCLLWAMSPGRLLMAVAVAAVFEAAAALTVGSFGVQPGLIPALVFIAYMLLQMLLDTRFTGGAVLGLLQPFVLVTLWALLTSFLMPRVFQGQVMVWPQRSAPPFVLTELAPSPSNLNQDIYLALNCLFLFLVATFLAGSPLRLGPFFRAYLVSGLVVAFIAFWQFASRVAGVPYPDTLLYSNPGWSILTEQAIGGVPRINGPFSEPSSLGSYMASLACSTGWLLLHGHRDRLLFVLFAAALATTALSTSTTGFGVLAIVAAGVPAGALLRGSTRLMAAFVRVGVPLLLCGALLFATLTLFVPSFAGSVDQVVTGTLGKRESASYEERTGADLDSIAAMVGTYGLGVGWGSNRSSSLVPGLAAGIGIPGIAGLCWFGFGLARQVGAARRSDLSGEERFVIDGCCGALTGFLIGALLSGPTINSQTFFLLLGLLVAALVRARQRTGRRTGHAPARTARPAARQPPGMAPGMPPGMPIGQPSGGPASR